MAKAENVDGEMFYEILNIEVKEWHPLPDGQGIPEQVHLWVEVDGWPAPIIIRFKSGAPMDELIMGLITHRQSVFGGPGASLPFTPA